MNALKTGILLTVIGALAVGIGQYFFGSNGAMIGLVLALGFQGFAFFNGHKMALRFAHAQELPPGGLPWLEAAAQQIAQRAGIPVPKLYISPDPQPNAFAAGRNPDVAVVCFNQGLLDAMPRDQVVAVMAHEFAHIKNRDSLTMTVVAAMGTFISFLANIAWLIPKGENEDRNPFVDILVMILAPITATIIQLAVSRTREYAADRAAALYLGDARPMMNALETLDAGTHRIASPLAQQTTAHMYIASPFNGGGLAKLFSTHPAIADRLQNLAEVQTTLGK
jgi:heat shock protein HtpX